MRKYLIAAGLCLFAASAVFASGSSESGKSGGTSITVALNFPQTDVTSKNINAIAQDFMKTNPSMKVTVTNPPDYENTMKTRMAADDLPDMWTTHGWSVIRYSEYLRTLNDRPWASMVNPAIKPVITDANGKIYVLPMDVDEAGIVFNVDVLNQAGVDPYAIKTWDDFMAACEKIKATGKTCVDVGGKSGDDRWTVGNFYDWVAPSYLITDPSHNSVNALKDGSFSWSNWDPVAKLLVTFRDKGYLNPDYTQGTWVEVGQNMASGKDAFGLFGNYLIGQALSYNPNVKLGFMPVPAAYSGDSPSMISGERTAIGIWKDDKAMQTSLAFIDWLAKPENVNLVAKGNQIPTGLVGTGYQTQAGDLTQYYDKVKSYRTFPYFDRAYLPSGMWDTMCITGTGLLANSMTVSQASAQMGDNYKTLIAK